MQNTCNHRISPKNGLSDLPFFATSIQVEYQQMFFRNSCRNKFSYAPCLHHPSTAGIKILKQLMYRFSHTIQIFFCIYRRASLMKRIGSIKTMCSKQFFSSSKNTFPNVANIGSVGSNCAVAE